MAHEGATLQQYNTELVKCTALSHLGAPLSNISQGIEDYKARRAELQAQISVEDEVRVIHRTLTYRSLHWVHTHGI